MIKDFCGPVRLVYPRGCGGTALAWPVTVSGIGLSPRVRGNLPAPPGSLTL